MTSFFSSSTSTFLFINHSTGLALQPIFTPSTSSPSSSQNISIHQVDVSYSPSQRWRVEKDEDSYHIIHQESGLALSAAVKTANESSLSLTLLPLSSSSSHSLPPFFSSSFRFSSSPFSSPSPIDPLTISIYLGPGDYQILSCVSREKNTSPVLLSSSASPHSSSWNLESIDANNLSEYNPLWYGPTVPFLSLYEKHFSSPSTTSSASIDTIHHDDPSTSFDPLHSPFTHRRLILPHSFPPFPIHIVECGPITSPLLIFCHGFPESWYSWKSQMYLLSRGKYNYHVVAMDMSGYGRSGKRHEEKTGKGYTVRSIIDDVVSVVKHPLISDPSNPHPCIIIGHDWGAPIAWFAPLFYPNVFSGVVGLSIPFYPATENTTIPPSIQWKSIRTYHKDKDNSIHYQFYQEYFLREGVAEREMERDYHETFRRIFYTLSGDVYREEEKDKAVVSRVGSVIGDGSMGMVDPSKGFLGGTMDIPHGEFPNDQHQLVYVSCPWLSPLDVNYYANEYKRNGFSHPLQWYRSMDENFTQFVTWRKQPGNEWKLTVPSVFIAGEDDMIMKMRGSDKILEGMERGVGVGKHEGNVMIKGGGHWIQQEKWAEVTREIGGFVQKIFQRKEGEEERKSNSNPNENSISKL